ncbi:MAG: hypothetical protein KKH88_00150 [Nanoarchaeota archaeon]|nr:hypothetical protein [Nanoarchaeota archaeon]
MKSILIILLISIVFIISGCNGLCTQEGEKCCNEEECKEVAIDCINNMLPEFHGCTIDCNPDWTCESINDEVDDDVITIPGVCVEKPGAECCKGEDCQRVAVDCSAGLRTEFYGCDANCEPDWGPCEPIESVCGNGICESNEMCCGCDPPQEGPDTCAGMSICPEDCPP